ncbi:hypothetical protein CVO74_13830 [Xanthomonas prunicola]|uniref:Uncharacterized protein n=1 Tax=Xanthomonas prunicola TaxID=2053930 RepID=A0A2N3RK65_9XANT|nr:hypothetical protein XpruCFBP8353_11685 [Xanthomonas prunicola]PKV17172.1 hypothetical protein XpruCFBP8354_11685 [Xanthomonas prunicola]PKV21072.1 hypothetical protein CVO74_13830 [Xanthomonas prunicola]
MAQRFGWWRRAATFAGAFITCTHRACGQARPLRFSGQPHGLRDVMSSHVGVIVSAIACA